MYGICICNMYWNVCGLCICMVFVYVLCVCVSLIVSFFRVCRSLSGTHPSALHLVGKSASKDWRKPQPGCMAQCSTIWWVQSVSLSPRPWEILSRPVLQQATCSLSFTRASPDFFASSLLSYCLPPRNAVVVVNVMALCLAFLKDGACFNIIYMNEKVLISLSVKALEKIGHKNKW